MYLPCFRVLVLQRTLFRARKLVSKCSWGFVHLCVFSILKILFVFKTSNFGTLEPHTNAFYV